MASSSVRALPAISIYGPTDILLPVVTELAVAAAHQGKHLGRVLLLHALEDAEKQGINIAGTPVPGKIIGQSG